MPKLIGRLFVVLAFTGWVSNANSYGIGLSTPPRPNIEGYINSQQLVEATVSGDVATESGEAVAEIEGLTPPQGEALRAVDGLVDWHALLGASTLPPTGGGPPLPNLLDLTGGNFLYTGRYIFDSGEALHQRTRVTMDEPGEIMAAMELWGTAPIFPSSVDITFLDSQEKWTQTTAGLNESIITISSVRSFLADDLLRTFQQDITIHSELLVELGPLSGHLIREARDVESFFPDSPSSTLSIRQTNFMDVPTPAAAPLFAIALAGLAWTRRKKA